MSRTHLLALLLLCSGGVQAEVFKWVDKQGNVQFSDNPPTNQQVETVHINTPPPASGNSAGSAATPAPAATDYRARQAKLLKAMDEDRAAKEEAARKAGEERAKQQAECSHAKRQLTVLNGPRVYTPQENGEKDYLSQERIDKEREQITEYIRRNCR